MKDTLLPGFGAQLAQAREACGLTVAEVAAKLKLTSRQVEALEAEDVERLPGDLFLRGFVRNYARLVNLDADLLIRPLDASSAVSATITARSEGLALGGRGLKTWLLIPVVVVALFVLAVALLYQWLSQDSDTLVPEPLAPAQTSPLPAAPAPLAPEPAPEPPVPPAAAPLPPLDPAPPASPAAPAAGNAHAITPVAPVPPPAQTSPAPLPAAPPSSPPPATTTRTLRLSASQDAWIQIVDGNGRRHSKLLRAGGSETITGHPPFRLVIGEAAQVNLSYDGRDIDLTPFIGQRVARLTLE